MHDEYWKKVKADAERRIDGLFRDTRTKVRDIVGDDNGIDEFADAKEVLAYVLRHGSCRERACAILSFGEWVHAAHELAEHGSAGAATA